MRVIEQLIDQLSRTGHLTADQLDQLRRMGLPRDKSNDHARPYEDYWGDEGNPWSIEVDSDPDGWDDHTERLLTDARRAARGRRRRASRRAANSGLLVAIERSLAAEGGFLDVVNEVARRLDPSADCDDAPRLVGSADPAALDAVLVCDSLWARLWAHVEREAFISGLGGSAQRRFHNLIGAATRSNKSIPAGLQPEGAVRRGLDVIAAHRALSGAFGRVALSVDRRRAFVELNLWDNRAAYEVLVILFNAANRRRVAELPWLPDDVGLPMLPLLRSPHFESGWAVAARLDPVAVLPYMKWCMGAWESMPARLSVPCRRLHVVNGVGYNGHVIGPSDTWFGLAFSDSRWHRVTYVTHAGAAPGEPTESIIRDGVRYVHCAPRCSGDSERRFIRTDQSEVLRTWWSTDDIVYRNPPACRGDYGAMWAAGLHDLPLLTCPKEWEL